jgi:D-aspartate ligase
MKAEEARAGRYSPAPGVRPAASYLPPGWPPVILLGGAAGTAISVARSLHKAGAEVYLLSEADNPAVLSRHARHIAPRCRDAAAWAAFLLDPASEPLRGAVLLACSDAALELVIDHRAELAGSYVLDVSAVGAQRAMLDKLATYVAAREAGVPTPRFWEVGSERQLLAQAGDYVYPLIVKPLFSHRYAVLSADKFLYARDLDELREAYRTAGANQLEVMLVEEVPGPDDLLCSYYTYVDESGDPCFDFTKRVIRRYPEHRGLACYHITDWNPEVRDLGRRLLSHVGLRGLANVEFKRDLRDGQLKLIECNARFTAANGLLTAAGCDLAPFVYGRLVGGAPDAPRAYRRGRRLWNPGKDFRAFLELRADGGLGLPGWLASVAHRQVFYYFRWDDPLPAAVLTGRAARRALRAGVRRAARSAIPARVKGGDEP